AAGPRSAPGGVPPGRAGERPARSPTARDETRRGLLPPPHGHELAEPGGTQALPRGGCGQVGGHRRGPGPLPIRRMSVAAGQRREPVGDKPRAATGEPEESEFRRLVERVLGEAGDRPVRVLALRREPSPFATLFPAEVASVSLEGGTGVSLFVKHLGTEQA